MFNGQILRQLIADAGLTKKSLKSKCSVVNPPTSTIGESKESP